MTTINNTTSTTPLPEAKSPSVKTDNSGASLDKAATNNAGAAAKGPSIASSNASSVITISTISSQLQAAQAATSGDSVFSTNKVNEIKAAISAGQFKVDSSRVADGLLQSVQGLLYSGKQSR